MSSVNYEGFASNYDSYGQGDIENFDSGTVSGWLNYSVSLFGYTFNVWVLLIVLLCAIALFQYLSNTYHAIKSVNTFLNKLVSVPVNAISGAAGAVVNAVSPTSTATMGQNTFNQAVETTSVQSGGLYTPKFIKNMRGY